MGEAIKDALSLFEKRKLIFVYGLDRGSSGLPLVTRGKHIEFGRILPPPCARAPICVESKPTVHEAMQLVTMTAAPSCSTYAARSGQTLLTFIRKALLRCDVLSIAYPASLHNFIPCGNCLIYPPTPNTRKILMSTEV